MLANGMVSTWFEIALLSHELSLLLMYIRMPLVFSDYAGNHDAGSCGRIVNGLGVNCEWTIGMLFCEGKIGSAGYQSAAGKIGSAGYQCAAGLNMQPSILG